jgi:hypothetical protein
MNGVAKPTIGRPAIARFFRHFRHECRSEGSWGGRRPPTKTQKTRQIREDLPGFLMEAAGIEPASNSTESASHQRVAEEPASHLAQTLARETQNDPELACVIDAWPTLPEHVRAAIVNLVRHPARSADSMLLEFVLAICGRSVEKLSALRESLGDILELALRPDRPDLPGSNRLPNRTTGPTPHEVASGRQPDRPIGQALKTPS